MHQDKGHTWWCVWVCVSVVKTDHLECPENDFLSLNDHITNVINLPKNSCSSSYDLKGRGRIPLLFIPVLYDLDRARRGAFACLQTQAWSACIPKEGIFCLHRLQTGEPGTPGFRSPADSAAWFLCKVNYGFYSIAAGVFINSNYEETAVGWTFCPSVEGPTWVGLNRLFTPSIPHQSPPPAAGTFSFRSTSHWL